VSGRRNHPAALATAEQLTALAGRLTDSDWQVCRLLADHQVLTTGLLALLLEAPPRTLQQRLTRLTGFRMVERFRPHQPLGAGSAPYHYLLGEAGAAVLAADPDRTTDPPGWDATQLLRLAHANGRRTHLLAVNTLLAQLTHAARHQPGTRLVCWWPARRCQAQWGPLIGPDAYARWQDPDGEVDFFLHHSPTQPAALLEGYDELAAASAIATPVLLHAGDPDQEAQLRDQLAGRRLLVPAATTNPTCGPPTAAVWLPTSSPAGGRRYRLGALGHPQPWHPTTPPPPPHRGRQPPGCARPVEGPAGWR
jgi:Replication-relaxation